jgi:F0F1-type ATP synthase assembly protein I
VDNDTKKTIKTMGHLSTVGLMMAISIALGAFIGYYLDKHFGTEPWLFFVFLALGIVAAFKNLIRMVKRIQE